jgi:hypothetical protein
MTYKILISIVVANLFSLAYAGDNPAIPDSKHSFIVDEPWNNMPQGSSDSSAPYQNCFKNSTWIVPPQTLVAYLYDNADFVRVVDQTVWVMSNYNQGYFSGQSYATIDNASLSQTNLIGSVTPQGNVYITFYSSTETSSTLITGLGTLTQQSNGSCYFIMQMNSGTNGTSGLTHWSYMVPVNPGDYFYDNLPSTNMSVPEFLAQFQ